MTGGLDPRETSPELLLDVIAGALADAMGPVSRVERDGPERAYVHTRLGSIILIRVSQVSRRHTPVDDTGFEGVQAALDQIHAMREDSER